jgi:GDP-L-fucose synthase
MKRIVVTGSTGFLGRHLMPILSENYPHAEITGLNRTNYDLMEPAQVDLMFKELKPEILIHLAAYSGGIGANRAYPADFYYQNTMLTTLMFERAAKNNVQKMLYTMGGCSYPATATSPIDESQMWNGYPQQESAGYSAAKKMGIVASSSYRQQYGLNSVVIIPGNMYGEYDNFRAQESHVVPAMIRRLYEAKLNGVERVEMWGTGRPQRDFVYAANVAKLIPQFIENYNSSEPVNVSSGTTTSIKELAETITEMMDFQGELYWDTSKPDGQMVKIFAVGKLEDIGMRCSTPLRDGLRNTISWLMEHYSDQTDGIRL